MRLYDSIGPNPHVVRIFVAEKGIDLDRVPVDLRGGENRRADYLEKNPWGQLPLLELDDGTRIAEITAICEYLDEIGPAPSLIGGTPEQRAETRMWVRRIDLGVIEPLSNGYRFSDGLKLFADRIHCVPEAAEGLKQIARVNLARIDKLLAGGGPFVCGDRLTLADVMLFAFINFAPRANQPIDPANTNVAAIVARMAARPSATA